MATVTSLTAEQIAEIASGWEAVMAEQQQLKAQVSDLESRLLISQQILHELRQMDIPELQQLLDNAAITVGNLNDNVVPILQQGISSNATTLDDLRFAQLPGLEENMDGLIERPMHFFSDEPPPEAPEDIELGGRVLQVDDIWHKTVEGVDTLETYRWTGTEWQRFDIEIRDLSITVQKFKTSTHQLY